MIETLYTEPTEEQLKEADDNSYFYRPVRVGDRIVMWKLQKIHKNGNCCKSN
jgi:hypothetical protein